MYLLVIPLSRFILSALANVFIDIVRTILHQIKFIPRAATV